MCDEEIRVYVYCKYEIHNIQENNYALAHKVFWSFPHSACEMPHSSTRSSMREVKVKRASCDPCHIDISHKLSQVWNDVWTSEIMIHHQLHIR